MPDGIETGLRIEHASVGNDQIEGLCAERDRQHEGSRPYRPSENETTGDRAAKVESHLYLGSPAISVRSL